jgi:hypothetical protein
MTSMMINLGARHAVKLTPFQERVLASEVSARIILFVMFFAATKDMVTSVTLTVFYVAIMERLLNENSSFFLF